MGAGMMSVGKKKLIDMKKFGKTITVFLATLKMR
jgi:hypothetical protein